MAAGLSRGRAVRDGNGYARVAFILMPACRAGEPTDGDDYTAAARGLIARWITATKRSL